MLVGSDPLLNVILMSFCRITAQQLDPPLAGDSGHCPPPTIEDPPCSQLNKAAPFFSISSGGPRAKGDVVEVIAVIFPLSEMPPPGWALVLVSAY